MGTILGLLAEQARVRGTKSALVAPGRPDLSFAALLDEVESVGQELAKVGLGHETRIALSIPSGPEAAVASLAVMAWAVCVPLNPALDRQACERLLRKLRVGAMIAPAGVESDTSMAAHSLGIRVLCLAPRAGGPVGTFNLRTDWQTSPGQRLEPGSGDLALLLHTSGTTATPKAVPLTHAQMVARSRSQPIDSRDRCLSVAPAFAGTAFGHSLLAPLAKGASIGYARDASPEAILDALRVLGVTYFSASPTVLSSLLDAIEGGRHPIPTTLRYVRSSSHALPSALQERLEAALGVPVIQGYGATEAGTIAQNPLPPAMRKPGSVGLPVGPEVAILDDKGSSCPPFEVGRVAVRGPGVMSGYEADADANDQVFQGEWFRTGDCGYLDGERYLFLTGRITEFINRGGLKIAPSEVDEALLRHPDVREVATFPVRHPTLGEDVAAAVVFREGTKTSAGDLRAFALDRLAPHKVPTVVVPVTTLARNALGKINRSELARELEHALRGDHVPAQGAREELVASLFASVLRLDRVGRLDNFFGLGGDSLSGMRVVASVNTRLGIDLAADSLFRWPTVAEFAEQTVRCAEAQPWSPPPIVRRRPPGSAAS